MVSLSGKGIGACLGLQGPQAQEMLGALFLIMFLCEKGASLKGPVQLPLASDSQGNVYGLLNAYPTAKLLMEIMF